MGRIIALYTGSKIFLLQPVAGWERNFGILIALRALVFACLMCGSYERLDEKRSPRTLMESSVGRMMLLYDRKSSALCDLYSLFSEESAFPRA